MAAELGASMNGANTPRSRTAAGKFRSKKARVCIALALAALAITVILFAPAPRPEPVYTQTLFTGNHSILDRIIAEKFHPSLYAYLLGDSAKYDSGKLDGSNLPYYKLIVSGDIQYLKNSYSNITQYLENKYNAKNIQVFHSYFIADIPLDKIAFLSNNVYLTKFVQQDVLYIGERLDDYHRQKPTVYNRMLDAVEWTAMLGSSIINTEPDSSRASANDIAVFAIVLSIPIIAVWLALFRHKLPGDKAGHAGAKSQAATAGGGVGGCHSTRCGSSAILAVEFSGSGKTLLH